MRIGAASILDAENQFPAPQSYQQNCPTELNFVDWMSNFKIKFSGAVLVASPSWPKINKLKSLKSVHLQRRQWSDSELEWKKDVGDKGMDVIELYSGIRIGYKINNIIVYVTVQ